MPKIPTVPKKKKKVTGLLNSVQTKISPTYGAQC